MKKKVHIIVAEDSPIVQHLICHNLKRLISCSVSCFDTSEKVIQSIESRVPDLLILDYFLGSFTDLDYGDSVLDHMDSKGYKVPTIFFSSIRNSEVQHKLEERGIYSFVSKNSDQFMEDLNQSVSSLIHWINNENSQLSAVYK